MLVSEEREYPEKTLSVCHCSLTYIALKIAIDLKNEKKIPISR